MARIWKVVVKRRRVSHQPSDTFYLAKDPPSKRLKDREQCIGAKAFRIACVYFKKIGGSRRSDRPRREESEAAKDL